MKNYRGKIKNLIFIYCFILGTLNTGAQSFDNIENIIVFKAPIENLKDVSLQSHKGLIRLGRKNQYSLKGTEDARTRQKIREKFTKINESYYSYFLLARLKNITPLLHNLNREERFWGATNLTTQEELQYKIEKLLHNLGAVCKTDDCKNSFTGANEFEIQRNYKNFTTNYLDPLVSYSETIFKDSIINGYYISFVSLRKEYDFDKNGYWISLPLYLKDHPRTNPKKTMVFQPKKAYEKNLLAPNGQPKNLETFLAIKPSKAEELAKNKISRLFIAMKIELVYNQKEDMVLKNTLTYDYSFDSPIFEFFTDEALTQKIGEISLENLISRDPSLQQNKRN